MTRFFASTLALALVLGSAVGQAQMFPKMDREQREQMLKKIHTGFVLELGEMLGLDTPGTIKLSERLSPYDKQRIQLRLDSWDAMQSLKSGKATNPGEAARRMARNRVQIAQIDQEELEEILKGLPAEKVAKIAVFCAEFPKRVERLGREIIRERFLKGEIPTTGGNERPEE